MIGNSINELISIAERQSDERLAQELNPQTETGMLGPTWLPASELAFRQKIRAEAQAQPQTNPPVVQQLAQASMPPMMPTAYGSTRHASTDASSTDDASTDASSTTYATTNDGSWRNG